MYTDSYANINKKRAGEKWCPTNGTEARMFFSHYCYKCKHFSKEVGCPIQVPMFIYSVEDSKYPIELQISEDGQPTCTNFEPKKIKGGE